MASPWKKLNAEIISCQRCPRLIAHCTIIAQQKRKAYQDFEYWGQPVPNLGVASAKLLIVGLAPAAHGANRTGRMFTGDRSGDWLFRAMHKAGFANQPESATVDDGLKLKGCAITSACHCAPPDNKPTAEEINNCQEWFDSRLRSLALESYWLWARLVGQLCCVTRDAASGLTEPCQSSDMPKHSN